MAKFKTKGLIVKFGTANPPTVTVGQLGDSTLELGEAEGLIDTTTHDTSGNTAEMLNTGWIGPAQLSGELLYDPADTQHEVIRAAHAAQTAEYVSITLPDTGAALYVFPCRVKSLGLPLPVKGKMAMNFNFEGTGAYSFTA